MITLWWRAGTCPCPSKFRDSECTQLELACIASAPQVYDTTTFSRLTTITTQRSARHSHCQGVFLSVTTGPECQVYRSVTSFKVIVSYSQRAIPIIAGREYADGTTSVWFADPWENPPTHLPLAFGNHLCKVLLMIFLCTIDWRNRFIPHLLTAFDMRRKNAKANPLGLLLTSALKFNARGTSM